MLTLSEVKGHDGDDNDPIRDEKTRKHNHITFSEEDNEMIVEQPLPGTKSSVPGTIFRSVQKAGPARRRQPSFKEDSPPLYDLFALSVCQ